MFRMLANTICATLYRPVEGAGRRPGVHRWLRRRWRPPRRRGSRRGGPEPRRRLGPPPPPPCSRRRSGTSSAGGCHGLRPPRPPVELAARGEETGPQTGTCFIYYIFFCTPEVDLDCPKVDFQVTPRRPVIKQPHPMIPQVHIFRHRPLGGAY